MKKTAFVLAIVFWIACLILLIIAVTDFYPSGPLKDYRVLIGIAFVASSVILRGLYNSPKG